MKLNKFLLWIIQIKIFTQKLFIAFFIIETMIILSSCGLIIDSARSHDKFRERSTQEVLKPGVPSSQIRRTIGDPDSVKIAQWPDGRIVEIWEYKRYKPDTRRHLALSAATLCIWCFLPIPLPLLELFPHYLYLVDNTLLAVDLTPEMLPPSKPNAPCSLDVTKLAGYIWECEDNTGDKWGFILRGDGTGWSSAISDFQWKQTGCDIRVEGMVNQTWTDIYFEKNGVYAKIRFDVGVTKWVFCVPRF